MPVRPVAILVLIAASLSAAETIIVTAEPESGVRLFGRPDPAADLRDLPGVAGIRMGGLGIDPVVRGQSGSRLLVLVDGACPHGGCPNRMDPPTSYAPAGADQVRVEPGGLGVRHPGAPLGIVHLDTPAPVFTNGRWHEATAHARVTGNGEGRSGGAGLAIGGAAGFAQARFESARAGNYEDGNGREVRSAYRSSKAGGTLGWTPDAQTRVELSHDLTRERDVLYAGAGMDAPTSDGATSSLRLRRASDHGLLASLTAEVYVSRVEHLMDNYSLRPAVGMLMRVPSQSDTSGGRAAVDVRLPVGTLGLGLDGEQLAQDARRYSGMTPSAVSTLNSAMWPDIRQRRMGAWGDLALEAADGLRVVPGLRYDVVDSRAGDAAVDPPGLPLSPDALYALYYGAEADDRREHLYGMALRVERDLASSGLVEFALSRQQRAADPTERFIAANGMSPSQRWIGNPSLEAETHWQAQARIGDAPRNGMDWQAEAWIDLVQDHIRRDRARAQPGVLGADQATIYRNGEALLLGALASGEIEATGWLAFSGDTAWTWGEDRDSGQPLAQIPPLAGRVAARFGPPELHGQAILRWSARATRVDDDPATGSAQDAGETPAWAVLDLRLTWRAREERGELAVGVDNLLDRTYAEHLNKPSAFDPTAVRVNEPGRSIWLSASATF